MITFIKNLIYKYRLRRRLKEIQKTDPFIYK